MPVKAPFFLPTVAGLEPTFDRSGLEEKDPVSKISSNSTPVISLVTEIGRQMEAYEESDHHDFLNLMNMLKDFTPSKLGAVNTKIFIHNLLLLF